MRIAQKVAVMPSQNESDIVWDRRPLGSGPCALVPVNSDDASFSDGFAACGPGSADVFVPPGEIGNFLKAHAGQGLIMPSAGEVVARLQSHLDQAGDDLAIQALWACADANRLYDPAIMAHLLELAGEDRAAMNSTDASAPTAVGTHRPLASGVNRLASDVYAAAAKLGARMADIAGRACIASETIRRFGPLTLGTQVRGAIALATAHRLGLRLEPNAQADLIRRCKEFRNLGLKKLTNHEGVAECFKGGRKPRLTRNGFPVVRPDKMQLWIRSEIKNVRDRHGAPVPYQSPAGVTDATIEPDQLDAVHLPVASLLIWRYVMAASRLRHALSNIRDNRIRPVYDILPTIRARLPDLCVVRRVADNPALSPADGGAFVVVNLPDLTLCALAALCEARNGRSVLADAARAEKRPAGVMADILAMSGAAGERISANPPQRLDCATAVLEAVATGLDAAGVSALLGHSGVACSRVECQQVMAQLDSSLPEIGVLLRDRRLERFAARLQLSVDQVISVLRPYVAGEVSTRVLSDAIIGTDNGQMANSRAIEVLAYSMADRTLAEKVPLTRPDECPRFYRDFVDAEDIVTLTGRFTARKSWVQARYGEVSLLADDALKEALFALTAKGFQLAGVAGNELVLQVGEVEDDEVDGAISECVMKGVSRAIPSIPITVEVHKQVLW
jgi:hypothetical protein